MREADSGRLGTVLYDLDAPDFSKGPLIMSGIAITSAAASRVPTASPDPKVNEFKDVLPAPPTATREFARNDELAIFAEIYDNIGPTAHRIGITASVLADDGKTVFTTSDERRSEELQGASGGYGYTTKIPLSGLAAGRYVLRLEAKSMLGNAEPSSARSSSGSNDRASTVAQGDASRIVDPRRIVVRTPEEWSKLWQLHAGSTAALPSVSFAERIVAAAFAGERPTAGHRIDIQADGDGGTVRLRVHERTPPGDALVAQVLTFPFHIVSLPRAAGNVSWAARSSGDEPTAMLASDSVASGLNPQSSTGLKPRTASALAYVAGPLSGGYAHGRNAQHGCPLSRLAVDSRDWRAAGGGRDRLRAGGPVALLVRRSCCAFSVDGMDRALDRRLYLDREPRRPLDALVGVWERPSSRNGPPEADDAELVRLAAAYRADT